MNQSRSDPKYFFTKPDAQPEGAPKLRTERPANKMYKL